MELAKGMSIAAGSTRGTMSDSYRVRTPGGLSTWLPLPVWWPEGAGQLEGRHTRETLGHLWARASRSLKKHVGQWKQWGPPLPSYRQTKSFDPLGDVVSIHLGELSQDSNPLLVGHISCDHFPSGGQSQWDARLKQPTNEPQLWCSGGSPWGEDVRHQAWEGTWVLGQNWRDRIWSRPNRITEEAADMRQSILWKTLRRQEVPNLNDSNSR